MTAKTIDINLTPRQAVAWTHLTDATSRYILYGGARGGGKSWLLCIWAVYWANILCERLGLHGGDRPTPIGFIGRKRGSDLRKTTLETWHRVIPRDLYQYKEQQGEIVLFDGRCKIFVGGLDDEASVNKFNSAEFAFFALDQAEEVTREDIAALRGSMRLRINGITPDYKELYTANPSDCWLKEDFIEERRDKYVYIPALPSDNPHLPSDYINTLEEAFRHSPALLRAYRDGDWTALKSSTNLLSSEDMRQCEGLLWDSQYARKVVACDPATSHDECVIYYMSGYNVEEEIIIVGESDTMKIAGLIVALARKHKVYEIGGDSIGLGSGIFDRVEELGEFRVTRINSSERAKGNFLNKRAEIYWNLMQKFIDKKIHAPTDEKLRRQLLSIHYSVMDSTGKIKIGDKSEIRRIHGWSTDRADCYAYAVYLSDNVDVSRETGDRRKHEFVTYDYSYNPNTV